MKVFKKLVLATAIVAFTATAAAALDGQISYERLPAGIYRVDNSHASITFKVNHLGLSKYTARFTKFDSDIILDPKDVTKSKVIAKIDPNSVQTDYVGEEDFNKKLATDKDWFNSPKFPEIKFESTKIEKLSDTKGKITGDLTFLGVTKPVTLDAEFVGAYDKHPMTQKAVAGFSASTTIKRSDFGFTTYVPMIGDEVAIQIEAEYGLDSNPAK